MEGKGQEVSLPPLNWDDTISGDRLVEWLAGAGWVMQGGMGMHGLTWQEISAWADRACMDPTPWEYEALKSLSDLYASSWQAAEDPLEPRPWFDPNAPKESLDQVKKVMGKVMRRRG